MRVELRATGFDPWQEVRCYQEEILRQPGRYGATACFIGTMREFNQGTPVRSMLLEHYPEMTQRYLEEISRTASDRWELLDTLVIHRYGEIHPDDPIVLIAVWSAHRAAAFDACRFLIEELKHRAPFWKKESLAGTGERWVASQEDP